jgi:hypothetical protein
MIGTVNAENKQLPNDKRNAARPRTLSLSKGTLRSFGKLRNRLRVRFKHETMRYLQYRLV